MMSDDDTIDGEEHPFDYTGVHAFLFIDQVQEGRSPEQVVEKLREAGKPPIMYASTFVGDFVAFAHVRVESLGELQNLIDGTIWEAGARCTWGLESPVSTLGAKRKSPGIIALTRIKMQPGTADDARDSLAEAGDIEGTGFVGRIGHHGRVRHPAPDDRRLTGRRQDQHHERVRRRSRMS